MLRLNYLQKKSYFPLVTAAASDNNDVGTAFIHLNLNLEGAKEGENFTLKMKPKELFEMLSQQGVNTN